MPKERMALEVASPEEPADEFGIQQILEDVGRAEILLGKVPKNPTLAKVYGKLLQGHEWELEKILGRFFHADKKEKDQRVSKRIKNLLTTLEQVSRALEAIRKKYPNVAIPPSLQVIENAEYAEDLEHVSRLRELIRRGEDTTMVSRVAEEIQEHLDLREPLDATRADSAPQEEAISKEQRQALKEAARYLSSKKPKKAA